MSIDVVSEPSGACVDIILVHGWSNNEQPWTVVSDDKAVCWPQSLLPNLVPQARIILFKYKANVEEFWAVESNNEIDSIAKDLLHEVIHHRTNTKTNDRVIILVAHSIGGVVCEKAILRARNGSSDEKELFEHVKQIAFIGTPFHTDGSEWTQTGQKFFQLAHPAPFDGDLLKSSKLTETCKKFLTLLKENRGIEIAVFHERRETNVGSTDIIIAGEEAVTIPGYPDSCGLKATHQGMVEVTSEEDDHFKRGFGRQLQVWVKKAIEAKTVDAKWDHYNISFSGHNNGLQIGANNGVVREIDVHNKGRSDG